MPWRNSSAGGELPLSLQTMKMRACWMLMLLAGCRLSRATPSQSNCTCDNNLTTVCVPIDHTVSVPCPYLDGKIKKYNLLLGPKMIYNLTCSSDNNGTKCKPPHNRAGVKMYENARNKSAHFTLTGVNARSHGVYRCEVVVELPPPYKTKLNPVGTLVLVEGYQCNINCASTEPSGDPDKGLPLTYIITAAAAAIYGLIMTIIASIACIKSRRIESQSDYMNTKPKPCRDRRKKKGVQNPIPRHF